MFRIKNNEERVPKPSKMENSFKILMLGGGGCVGTTFV